MVPDSPTCIFRLFLHSPQTALHRRGATPHSVFSSRLLFPGTGHHQQPSPRAQSRASSAACLTWLRGGGGGVPLSPCPPSSSDAPAVSGTRRHQHPSSSGPTPRLLCSSLQLVPRRRRRGAGLLPLVSRLAAVIPPGAARTGDHHMCRLPVRRRCHPPTPLPSPVLPWHCGGPRRAFVGAGGAGSGGFVVGVSVPDDARRPLPPSPPPPTGTRDGGWTGGHVDALAGAVA